MGYSSLALKTKICAEKTDNVRIISLPYYKKGITPPGRRNYALIHQRKERK
jgi:hypothetical protein